MTKKEASDDAVLLLLYARKFLAFNIFVFFL